MNQHIFKVEFEATQFDKRFLQLAINQNLNEYIRAAHGGAGLAHIFCDFALAKHKVLGNFCTKHFDRINGRIGLEPIRKDYLPRFGTRYEQRFQRALEKLERQHLVSEGASIKASYGNLITWRNDFAHEGNIPVNASYAEVKRAYDCGKIVMTCLSTCMHR